MTEFDLETTVVVGYNNPHLPGLRELAEPWGRVQFIVNATNMPELIASADVAVAAAGTTSLEMCFLGLPALLTVLAENQRAVAEELNRRGAAIQVGEGAQATLAESLAGLLASPERRKAMSGIGRKLVDGLGASRVVAQLQGNA